MSKKVENLLRDICFRIKVKGREVLKEFPITPAQFDLMQKLYFAGEQTMTELSRMLGIAKSTTTGLVSRLENEGFVERKRRKNDKRIIIVVLTKKGEYVIDKVIFKRIEFVEEVLKDFDNNSKEVLVSLLEKLNNSVKRRGG
ncbi:MarR family transcriptional regulator [Thermosipho melanesiensis]|uniref:Transcriptional regulator, TrmB n=2 Tax=Thermosipho melanesiensis TaxID=46541 RepID=A6LN75_THEM4|nr:MarR family transcriptional regulator [Thermosipho melanesiensis]ABR31376.1 transcriptional regulator, TrmB [Thermosipho melanesiensis BI429]APT74436.1 MarR family transcriptional regulator [Thermosipho melanesiensis]OOC36398.1 MarR family transcriptional regulator [Thermosipho melanesiensis]OOC37216.1 MarR family transcriptional regulator [Thermosipho melanesiensis]OOC37968.1 MarR family transcriptional regulator [Thermosipho melanesiensis]